jgi:predicted dehydrogenase
MDKYNNLRIGLIGAGNRSYLIDHAHQPEKGVRLVAAADVNHRALEKLKGTYGSDLFTTSDYRELLARPDMDAVFILSPDFLHEEHAVAALEAQKAVYLEKPIAVTIDGADRILRMAYDRQTKLYLGHNMRHMGFVLKMKELIDEGRIGQVKAAWCRHFVSYGGDAYFKDWHCEQTKATGLLLQKGAHDIDVMHWLCRGFTRRVSAMGALTVYNQVTDRHSPNEPGEAKVDTSVWPPLTQKGMHPAMDVEDLSMMLMEFDNGVFASYQQCHYTADAWRNYTFIGTEGRIENIGDSPGRCVIRVWNRRQNEYNPFGDEQYFIPDSAGSHGGSDPSIVDEFLNFVANGNKVSTSPVAARYAVAAGCLATQSLRNGSVPLVIPELPAFLADYFNRTMR